MKMTTTSFAVGLLAAAFAPGLASASFVLDTGAPTSVSGGLDELTPTQWYAAQFTLTSAETISSLAAYLEPLPSSTSTAFQFDLYSGSNFIGARTLTPLDTATGTYTAAGWNTTNVNYALAAGTYWLAIEATPGPPRTVVGFDVPTTGITTSTGTAPASAFAYYGGSSFSSSNTGIGLQIQASPVPLPGAAWLFGSALLGLGAMGRRRAALARSV